MKVTILIDSYNYRDYVGQAIESALGQTYPDVEVIVADDGSTDGSQEVIRRYEPRIQAVYKSNGGQASAFNAGWKLATGDIVFLLDCDDALKPDAAAKAAAAWRPEFSKLHFPLEVCNAKLQTTGAIVPRAPLAQGNLRDAVLEEGVYISPPTSGNVFSRRFLEAVLPMPEPQWVQAADAYLISIAALHGEIGALSEPLGYYRMHAASTTSAAAIGPAKLTRMLSFDCALHDALESWAGRMHARLNPQAGLNHWIHLKLRLASCKLSGALHPFPEDRVSNVAWRLMRSVLRAAELSTGARLAFIIWALLVAGLPQPLSRPIVKAAFAPGHRAAGFLKSMLPTVEKS